MRNLLLLTIISFCILNSGFSQEIKNGAFTVNNTSKKYSLYIPSGYDANVPHQLMLGLHPLNTNRWNGESWRDTLINFSETNNLIFVSPDGGPDGRIDDPIDTTFTSALLDSVALWYNINQDEKYIMGFSWGGRTTYTYGLRRTDDFAGYIVIGAAIDGIGLVSDVIENAENENFYLIHGSQDAPAVRFTPLLNALNDNNACTETNFLIGVGHTIDFPDRNLTLSKAFQWIKNNNCNGISSSDDFELSNDITVVPNPSDGSFKIQNFNEANIKSLEIFDIAGKKINYLRNNNTIQLDNNTTGLLLLIIQSENGIVYNQKIIIY